MVGSSGHQQGSWSGGLDKAFSTFAVYGNDEMEDHGEWAKWSWRKEANAWRYWTVGDPWR